MMRRLIPPVPVQYCVCWYVVYEGGFSIPNVHNGPSNPHEKNDRLRRALEYRRQRGPSLQNVQLAVLVQQLIVSDVSIVAFSMNPVTLNRAEVMITASWGLGESLVSGTVTPDTFVVRKSDLEVTSQTVADKGRMTVPVPGGTREVDVPRFLRSEACLGEEQLIEVAQLALSLEATMRYPVDVECAYAGRKLYLLQCRPITTLG